MQKGFITLIIVTGVSFLIVGGVWFYHNKIVKSPKVYSQINTFEDCAKIYPIMESFPEQCNTPDGQHFVRTLSEEEQKKILPPQEVKELENNLKEEWTTFQSLDKDYSVRYPGSLYINCSSGNGVLLNRGESCDLGDKKPPFSLGKVDRFKNYEIETDSVSCLGLLKEIRTIDGVKATKYSYTYNDQDKKCSENISIMRIKSDAYYTFEINNQKYELYYDSDNKDALGILETIKLYNR